MTTGGRFRLIGWIAILCSMVSCSQDTPALPTVVPRVESPRTLTVYNWDTYIDPQIVTDFENEFDIAIDYQVFDSDEDLLEELLEGATDQFDVIMPSDVTVTEMRDNNLLAPINKENIPNFTNIDPLFVNPVFDPANRYCVPYQWGTVGIGYNIEATGGEIEGWDDFFDPRFAGRVAMLDDYRTTLGIALLLSGYSPNTTNSVFINEAAEFLNKRSEHIGAYTDDDAQDLLVAGEYDLVMEWSGDVFQVMEENASIRYLIPKEGSIIWTDNMCIPSESPSKELAETFINYILDPEVGATLSNYIQYGSPNQAALPFINVEDLNNPAIYPTKAVRQRLFFLVDVDLAANNLYEEAWEGILSNKGT